MFNGMKANFRDTIQKELAVRGWSGYRLAKECGLPERTIQAFLAGTNDTTSERLALICDALGLELRKTRKGR